MLVEFKEVIEMVLHHEGGYVNDPKDPGGETKYGVSETCLFRDLDIKNLTQRTLIFIREIIGIRLRLKN